MEIKYKDPDNYDLIFKKITESKTIEEIYNLIKSIYPEWIMFFLKSYSLDYPHLQRNWEIATEKNNIKTADIMIVEYLKPDENHKLIGIFSEILTATGFIVRSIEELFPCSICDRAIPCENTFNLMKEKGVDLPIEKWDKICSGCSIKK